jgi:hypothetical protein
MQCCLHGRLMQHAFQTQPASCGACSEGYMLSPCNCTSVWYIAPMQGLNMCFLPHVARTRQASRKARHCSKTWVRLGAAPVSQHLRRQV